MKNDTTKVNDNKSSMDPNAEKKLFILSDLNWSNKNRKMNQTK